MIPSRVPVGVSRSSRARAWSIWPSSMSTPTTPGQVAQHYGAWVDVGVGHRARKGCDQRRVDTGSGRPSRWATDSPTARRCAASPSCLVSTWPLTQRSRISVTVVPGSKPSARTDPMASAAMYALVSIAAYGQDTARNGAVLSGVRSGSAPEPPLADAPRGLPGARRPLGSERLAPDPPGGRSARPAPAAGGAGGGVSARPRTLSSREAHLANRLLANWLAALFLRPSLSERAHVCPLSAL